MKLSSASIELVTEFIEATPHPSQTFVSYLNRNPVVRVVPKFFRTASSNSKLDHRKQSSRGRRKGVAAVEFAVVAPIFFTMIFLMVESSRYLMALHATTGAARSAARAIAVAGVSDSDATKIAKDYMSASSFPKDTVTLDIDREPSTVSDFDQISCTVTIDFDDVSVIGDPFSIGASEVTGRSAMLSPN
ncbi:pilus assembly protein [Mariniblastus sp.]|nr:pilus assembly protein [Mariniblastus sp.]